MPSYSFGEVGTKLLGKLLRYSLSGSEEPATFIISTFEAAVVAPRLRQASGCNVAIGEVPLFCYVPREAKVERERLEQTLTPLSAHPCFWTCDSKVAEPLLLGFCGLPPPSGLLSAPLTAPPGCFRSFGCKVCEAPLWCNRRASWRPKLTPRPPEAFGCSFPLKWEAGTLA